MVKGNTMPASPAPFLCYGESHRIAQDALPKRSYVYGEPMRLALDASSPKQTLRDIFAPPTPRPTKPARRPIVTDESQKDDTMDYDMKVKVLTYLREKLDPDELKEVASLLGTEVDTTGMDRRGGMASDASLSGEERTLEHRLRAGQISEGQYAQGVRDIRRRRGTIAQDGRPVVTPLDKLEAEFPHMKRLKR